MGRINSLLLHLALVFVLFSCGLSKEEQLVADYEQSLGETKLELDLKIISMEKVGETFYSDSVPELEAYLKAETEEKIEQLRTRLYPDPKDSVTLAEMMALYQGDKKGTYLEAAHNRLQKYKELGATKIGDVWAATYKIKNPLLNGVEQEVSKKYLIDPEGAKIIQTIEE